MKRERYTEPLVEWVAVAVEQGCDISGVTTDELPDFPTETW